MAAPGITKSGEKTGSASRILRQCSSESGRESMSSCLICRCCSASGVRAGGVGGAGLREVGLRGGPARWLARCSAVIPQKDASFWASAAAWGATSGCGAAKRSRTSEDALGRRSSARWAILSSSAIDSQRGADGLRSAAEPGLEVLLNTTNKSGIAGCSAGSSGNVRLLLAARTAEPPAEAPAATTRPAEPRTPGNPDESPATEVTTAERWS